MLSEPLPERVDAFRVFSRRLDISGTVSGGKLQRLGEYLSPGEELVVDAALSFGHNEAHRRQVTGNISASLSVPCQRCLGPMPLALECPVEVQVVADEAALGPQGDKIDALVCDEDTLDLLALVEDELILSLPLAPRHDEASCNSLLEALQDGETDDSSSKRRSLAEADSEAFAQLQALKNSFRNRSG